MFNEPECTSYLGETPVSFSLSLDFFGYCWHFTSYNILNKENQIAKLLLIAFEVNQFIVIATKIYKTDQLKKI